MGGLMNANLSDLRARRTFLQKIVPFATLRVESVDSKFLFMCNNVQSVSYKRHTEVSNTQSASPRFVNSNPEYAPEIRHLAHSASTLPAAMSEMDMRIRKCIKNCMKLKV